MAGTATFRELSSDFSDRKRAPVSYLLRTSLHLWAKTSVEGIVQSLCPTGLAGWVCNPETPCNGLPQRSSKETPLDLPVVLPPLWRTLGTFSRIPSFYQPHCSGHKAAVSQTPKDRDGWAEAGSNPVTVNIHLGRQHWLGPLGMGQSWPKHPSILNCALI